MELFKIFCVVCVSLIVIAIGGMIVNVATAPVGVVNQTVSTGNIVASYESFYDRLVQYEAKVAQIRDHKALVDSTEDSAELSRIRIELNGMKQACRELAGQYNADSQKLTVGTFKGRTLPSTLSASSCE